MSHAFSPNGGAVVLLVPGLIAAFEYVFADPLMIALILLALVLDASQKRRPALVALAAAILVKEIAAVALVTWFWRAWTRRDWRRGAEAAAAVIPYLGWAAWVRLRIGEWPFLAHTYQRSGAIGNPGHGVTEAFRQQLPDHSVNVLLVLATKASCYACLLHLKSSASCASSSPSRNAGRTRGAQPSSDLKWSAERWLIPCSRFR